MFGSKLQENTYISAMKIRDSITFRKANVLYSENQRNPEIFIHAVGQVPS